MGHIRESFGHVTVESRSESFIIHADYGYEPGFFALRDFAAIGEEFIAYRQNTTERRHWKVTLIAEDRVEAREAVSSVIQTFHPDSMVERPGYEQDAEGSFAEHWRGPHPEFVTADLDDLIAALTDFREAR